VSAYQRHNRPGVERRWIRSSRGDGVVQPPSVALRVVLLAAVAVTLIGIIVFRLWFLQILSAQQYVAQANDNRLRTVAVLAPRGTVLDRNGTVMVDNRPGLAVGIRPMDVPAGQLDPLVKRLAHVLSMKPGAVRKEMVRQVGVPWNQITTGLGLQYDFVTIKQDTSRAVVSYLLEHTTAYPGVEVRQNYLRDYPLGIVGAHFLGYLGEIDQKELTESRFRGYKAGDVIGKSGVEYTYDKWLRGINGSVRVEVDARGRPKQVVPGGTLPQAGDNLQLSIDAKVQRAAENAVNYGIDLAHANDEPAADGGAAVVLDAHTGEVVAMASEPNFNPAWYVGGLSAKHWKKLTVKTTPLLDRTIQGVYPMGSTFKVVDSIAALEDGVISPTTTLEAGATYTNHGLLWHDWNLNGHGAIDLTQAIVQSADTYFYQIGYDFYLRPGKALENWAWNLGLGHPTGIDLPGEVGGLVPTPGWKHATFTKKTDPKGWQIDRLWKPGDSINLAIGQGNLETTPMQAAVTYAAIANGGYLVTPHVGVKIVDAQGRLVRRLPYTAPRSLGISQQTIGVVQNALHLAATTPAGTSYGTFGHYPVQVAGKTGTAQVAGQSDYAWYASYAPANDPKYVVVVMIQQGGHGGVSAAPAARMIYDSLFHISGGQATGSAHSD
jgi:penicillin-binding protein 2